MIWVDAKVPFEDVARVLGGEKVERGANVLLWQSERNLALKQSRIIEPNGFNAGVDQPIRIVSQPRAYIEALHGAGRSQEVAQNLREKILRNDSK
jgi:prophage antirepressor-like protein